MKQVENQFQSSRFSGIGLLLENAATIADVRSPKGCSEKDATLLEDAADIAAIDMATTLTTVAAIIREWRMFIDDPIITEKQALDALETLAIMTGEVISEARDISSNAYYNKGEL